MDCYDRDDQEALRAAFSVLERLLTGGSREVRELAMVGIIEDLRNIASWRPYGSQVFETYLGPESARAWSEVAGWWKGKRSLMEVLRAEKRNQSER